MVQDSYSSAKPKSKVSETKNIDLYTWVSDNSSIKLFLFSLLALTLASLFFIYSSSSAPIPFFCLKNGAPVVVDQPQMLIYPELHIGSTPPVLDKSSPFSKFHSEKWIVVSVSDYPSKSLEKLVKIKGWQVLAIGNSKTPKDWELKGAIFLSLEMQADLGFRVVDYLPYDSYVRKNVGYLFAVQHGAKMIYDGDDRGEVIGGDLGKHFDLNLDDEIAKKPRVLMRYSKSRVSNRTVVNPYIHFGQRSVWPRGLPLENVGMINHEEFYEEVYGGKQYKYIQQGICNGLPDVDSVFYSTRKSGSEKFEILFDGLAPKVSLPQGLMVPLNSMNTLFHYDAFWALMLPVSVSTMASDIMRGYFAQRLLWELDGFVVVNGPTIHRHDDVESYPFLEEKDLHVNVGQMIDFLISWKSEKQSFYEKILDLSFSVAEKEFWNENDVKLTAAWVHDLVSVGYKQRIEKTINTEVEKVNSKKEYIPTKLSSIHLGIKETETVNYEIGNLIRWRKSLGNVVLIMFISGNVQHTALEWRLLYGRIFKTVVILSNLADGDLAVESGDVDHVYKYLPKIFQRFDKAQGFLYLHDNTILNYWNLLQADKSKLWIANKVPTSRTGIDQDVTWFSKQAETVNSVLSSMPAHLQINYKQSNPNHHQNLALCGSEIFYIPQHFLQDYIDLVDLVGNLQIHYKVAIPMFFMAMDSPVNFDPVLNRMIYDTQSSSSTSGLTYYSANVPAVHPCNVSSEYDFVKLIRLMAVGDPLLLELI